MTRDNREFGAHVQYPVGSMPPSSYIAKQDWATSQLRGGLRQKQCRRCGLWLFPQEIAAHNGFDGMPCSGLTQESKS